MTSSEIQPGTDEIRPSGSTSHRSLSMTCAIASLTRDGLPRSLAPAGNPGYRWAT